MKKKNQRISVSIAKAFGITTLAFLLSFILMQPISFSVMSVFTPPEKEDYNISDFYAQLANKRPVRNLEKDIVLVDIGLMDRRQIATLIEDLSLCGVKALGVDIMFSDTLPGDEHLLNAISLHPEIVMPIVVKSEGEDKFSLGERPFFHGKTGTENAIYGASNLPGKHKGSTIREFVTGYPTATGDTIASFPVAIARIAAPEAAEALARRGNRIEIIDYPSHEFTIMQGEEVFGRAEELAGKIVIVGTITDASDMHSTPVNSYLSGMYIHACALSTILSGRYYTVSNPLLNWIMAFLLCFAVTLTGLLLDPRLKILVVRTLQFLLVYLTVQAGYLLYVEKQIIVNFSYTLLMLTFGLFAADIWNGSLGMAQLLKEKFRKRSENRERKGSKERKGN